MQSALSALEVEAGVGDLLPISLEVPAPKPSLLLLL